MFSGIILVLATLLQAELPSYVVQGWKEWERRIQNSDISWKTEESEEKEPSTVTAARFSATHVGDTFALNALPGGRKRFDSVVAVNDKYSFRIQRKPGGQWAIDKFAPPSNAFRQMAMQEMIIVSAPYFIPTATDIKVESLLDQNWVISSVREHDDSVELDFTTEVKLGTPVNGATWRSFEGAMKLSKSNSFGITNLNGVLEVGDGTKTLTFPWEINVEYASEQRFGLKSVYSVRGTKPSRFIQKVQVEKFESPAASSDPVYIEAYGLTVPSTVSITPAFSNTFLAFLCAAVLFACLAIWIWVKRARAS